MVPIRSMPIILMVVIVGCSQPGDEETAALRHAKTLDPPWTVAEFELVNQAGTGFSRQQLLGRWTVLFSGFTHCPDICPATLGILRSAGHELEARGDLQTVFVSVDPQRDTPQRLAEYLGLFDEDWIGLTGDAGEIGRLLASMQMAHVRVPTTKGEYTMDHAAAVALIDPDARMIAYWPAPLEARALAEDLNRLPRP